MPDSQPLPVWYAGVCDSMLAKVAFWANMWETGEAFATRDWLSPKGEIVPIVTKRLVKVPWPRGEFEHLLRTLSDFLIIHSWMEESHIPELLPKWRPR